MFSSVLTGNSVFKQKLCDSRFLYWIISKQRPWFHVDACDVSMAILTSLDIEQKLVTQIIQMSKMAALEQWSAIKFCVHVANKKSRQETFEMLKTALEPMVWRKLLCINGTVSLSDAVILLLMNRGKTAPHPSQQRNLNSQRAVGLWSSDDY